MSESGYQEIDLDNPGAAAASADSDIEIVEESQEPEAPPAAPERAPSKARDEEPDHEEDESSQESASPERRKLTRSQRLKNQRDEYAKQLNEAQAKLAAVEARARKAEAEATEGASIGFDLYIKQLDTSMQALRRDFDSAYDNGDRDRIFDLQQQIASIAAARAQAEKDRRSIPAQPQRQAPAQQQPQQQQQPGQRQPSPAAMEWYQRNKEWFNKDPVLTAGARVLDQQMVADGYTPSDPDYFEELDSRLKKEFPHKFGGAPAAATRQAASNPTIQNRSAPAPATGKIRVSITQADREMANHLGIGIEQYAREKAKKERAEQTVSQYTEIL
jgi:hypothetical protein